MNAENRKTIGGVEFEAVRMDKPIKHWRARVVATGYLFAAGCFKSASRPQLFESIAESARHCGRDFHHQTIDASDDRPRAIRHGANKNAVLWGFHPDHANGEPIKLSDNMSDSYAICRRREGWIVAVYAAGDEPLGLRSQATAQRSPAHAA